MGEFGFLGVIAEKLTDKSPHFDLYKTFLLSM